MFRIVFYATGGKTYPAMEGDPLGEMTEKKFTNLSEAREHAEKLTAVATFVWGWKIIEEETGKLAMGMQDLLRMPAGEKIWDE